MSFVYKFDFRNCWSFVFHSASFCIPFSPTHNIRMLGARLWGATVLANAQPGQQLGFFSGRPKPSDEYTLIRHCAQPRQSFRNYVLYIYIYTNIDYIYIL